MLAPYLAALRATLLGTFPLALLAWIGLELLWGCIRRQRPDWEGVTLRCLLLWALAIFLSIPGAERVWHPLREVDKALFGLGGLAGLGSMAYWLVKRPGP